MCVRDCELRSSAASPAGVGNARPSRCHRAARLCLLTVFALVATGISALAQPIPHPPVIGMYVHQHWPYHHPYSARTWTLGDWRGYVDGLHKLGFNTIMIWPILETMPDPFTPSDEAALRKTSQVIDMLHKHFAMRVFVVLSANVVANDEVARKASFETRHFYYSERFANPADPAAVADLMRRREKSLRYLAAADAIAIIDSDPGGYPDSTNPEFISLLKRYRALFDKLRPGIELIYWVHVGWPAYGRWYATGKFGWSTPAEYDQAITLASRAGLQPWGLAGARREAFDKPEWRSRAIAFNYGRIESEPSFPMTNFGGTAAHDAGADPLPGGVMGNAQTHCAQLPNTFAFARGATGKPTTDQDYLEFADQIIPGHGATILAGWKAIGGADTAAMRKAAAELETLAKLKLTLGPLGGLLFGDPQRFVDDLVKELNVKAAYQGFLTAASSNKDVGPTLAKFAAAAEVWQRKNGYQNLWYFPDMQEALRNLHVAAIDHVLDEQGSFAIGSEPFGADPGATPLERIKNGFAEVETYTAQLLRAMKQAAAQLK
jgi:hypothetical protein